MTAEAAFAIGMVLGVLAPWAIFAFQLWRQRREDVRGDPREARDAALPHLRRQALQDSTTPSPTRPLLGFEAMKTCPKCGYNVFRSQYCSGPRGQIGDDSLFPAFPSNVCFAQGYRERVDHIHKTCARCGYLACERTREYELALGVPILVAGPDAGIRVDPREPDLTIQNCEIGEEERS